MRNIRCIYYAEGPCERKLIAALKETPNRILPGKVRPFNVVQNLIPRSQLLSLQAGTLVALVFDTDTTNTAILQKNIELINRYCKVKIIYLVQVMNLEDELARCTDVRCAQELTKSDGVHNFKSDFCKMNSKACRDMLERHRFNVGNLWITDTPDLFSFIEKNSTKIKT